jgi:pimeloyl-ACP methyl ester carboxylesterase
MSGFPDALGWRSACVIDPVLQAWGGSWSVGFAVRRGEAVTHFAFRNGVITGMEGAAEFTLTAPAAIWDRFLEPMPPRHHHSIFAMHRQVSGFAVEGDILVFAQHCHVARRVLEVGKWLALGNTAPAPASLRPPLGDWPMPALTGSYVSVTAAGRDYRLFRESAGTGRDVLCLHTAGADGRQFHRLMGDGRITAGHKMTAFDLPWHGRSLPPAGGIPGSWSLNTDLYVELIMGFIAAADLDKPIVLGASMSGEICLELAYRHPESFTAIIACEASERIEGRKTPFAYDPRVNQAFFIPEWILGLMAPQSPAEPAADVAWGYAQGGPHVFAGDIDFYAGDWDARDRVGKINTNICPLFMLTGEYDYSCTTEMSAATAAKIPGAHFQAMPGMGHFPFAENPRLFADYLLPILAELHA